MATAWLEPKDIGLGETTTVPEFPSQADAEIWSQESRGQNSGSWSLEVCRKEVGEQTANESRGKVECEESGLSYSTGDGNNWQAIEGLKPTNSKNVPAGQ